MFGRSIASKSEPLKNVSVEEDVRTSTLPDEGYSRRYVADLLERYETSTRTTMCVQAQMIHKQFPKRIISRCWKYHYVV